MSESVKRAEKTFHLSRKMNEQLENLTCVPPWTLSPKKIEYFRFSRRLLLWHRTRSKCCRSAHSRRRQQKKRKTLTRRRKANEKRFNAFFLLRHFGPRHNKNHVYRAFSSARQAYNETTTKWKAFYANNFFFRKAVWNTLNYPTI